jgi:hypothetical protein
VVRILVDHWHTLPRLAKLCAGNSDFRKFVLGHVDVTVNRDDVERVKQIANAACPSGLLSLCADLIRQADAAIEEDASYRKK